MIGGSIYLKERKSAIGKNCYGGDSLFMLLSSRMNTSYDQV